MKKVILSLVFVLATGSMMNAVNSIKEEVQVDCIQLAFDIDAETPLSYEQFNAVVSKCDKAQLKKVE
jgi:D-ribose pyranose/furanose isomerase RbsD